MYWSSLAIVVGLMPASMMSQAGVRKIASGASMDDDCGRMDIMFCTSASCRYGRPESTASGAVLTLIRPGMVVLLDVVTLSRSTGNNCWRLLAVSGLGYCVLGLLP